MRKNYLLLFVALFSCTAIFCQVNRQTLYLPNYNLMNPSILKCSDKSGYMISGSAVVDENTSEAFLAKINKKGTVLWTQLYQLNSSPDTRSYGMAEHVANGTVLLTGYYDQSGQRFPYVLELDASNGNIVNSVNLDICDNVASSNCSGYGLDIIVDSQDNVLVAGFGDDGPLNSSSTQVHGYIFKLDQGLNSVWFKGIESDIPMCQGCVNCPTNTQFPMVGRIVEVPNGYFITGSLGDYQAGAITQVVLAAQISFAGALDWQSPFSFFNDCGSGNDDFHVGSDAFNVGNAVLMAANYSNSHGFAISYLDANQGNHLSDIYYGPTDHYFAHSIMQSQINQSAIIVSGIKHYPGSNNDVLFVASVEKGSNIIFWEFEYDITIDAPHFETFGNTDDRLIPYRGVYAPFINYPEMITTTDKGYLVVCNRVDGPGFPMAIDLIEIDLQGNPTDPNSPCMTMPMSLTANLYSPVIKSMGVTPKYQNNVPGIGTLDSPQELVRTRCNEPLSPLKPKSNIIPEEALSNSQTIAYPNPAKAGMSIEILLPAHSQNLSLYNLMGQEVKKFAIDEKAKRFKLDSRQLQVGVYIYTLETPSGLVSNRIVISH